MREGFEFRIMGCDESCASVFKQMTQYRTRQRRAFLRIGPCTQFIENNQRTVVNVLQNANDVRDMTAECAERLLDGLLIADIRIDRVETQQLRAALRRDVKSALRHEGEQT